MPDAVTARQLLSVAADDQQRVVDARAEPEHDAERGSEAREVGERAGELEQQQATGERDQGRDQRESHRRHRAEHDREHDDRHSHADELTDRGRGLLGLVHDRPVAGHLEAGALAQLGCRLEPLARVLAECGRGVVVLNRHVCDPRVLGQLAAALSERVRRARHVRLGADLPDRSFDRRLALRRAERARVHGEDDVRGVARGRRKALLEHVDRGLRFGAGGLEVVDERAAGGARADADRDEHDRHDRE